MRPQVFIRRTRIDAPASEVFAWHALPGALECLTPPWERVKLIERTNGIQNGSRVVLEGRSGPLRFRWTSEHCDYREGQSFTDIQTSGPFAYWKHVHSFEPVDARSCILQDRIEYRLPFGVIGQTFGGWWVRRKLERLFQYRHAVTVREIARRNAGLAD